MLAVSVEEIREGTARKPQLFGSVETVEHVHEVKTQVSLQPHDVICSTVQYLRRAEGLLKQVAEFK